MGLLPKLSDFLLDLGKYNEALQVCQCAKCRKGVSVAIKEVPAADSLSGLANKNQGVSGACLYAD